jgi:FkbM family methyltransferase
LNNQIKNLLTSFTGKLGLEVIAKWRLNRLPQAKYLKRLFDQYQIDCVFDVGANGGQYGQFLRREVGYEGQIISFEPAPVAFEVLEPIAAQYRNWIALNYALGSSEGEASFNLMKNSEFGSLLKFKTQEAATFGTNADQVGEIKVPVRRLDSVYADLQAKYGFDKPYLKVDTQGFDHHVIEGSGTLISKFTALQSEASVVQIYEGSLPFNDLINLVTSKGFLVSAFHPNNDGHFPKLIEFDCHFINASLLKLKK